MRVLIIGGTTGIGWALAEHYLRAGHTVGVAGRDLRKIALDTAEQFPQLMSYELDIADRLKLGAAIHDFSNPSIDLLIVSAGVYYSDRHQALDEAMTQRMLQTNVIGLHQAFELASEKMLLQKSGHLVAIASVAGLLNDYPGASLYSATKRSAIQLCDTYHRALTTFGISVTAIVPGYMNTEKLRQLNAGDASHKPFLLSEQEAVRHIVNAISRRDTIHVFPWQMRWLIRLLNRLPKRLLSLRR